MRKVMVLMLAFGLAVPVNAVFRAKTVLPPAPVTKTNYVACAVVGAVAFVVGILAYKTFHTCPKPEPGAIGTTQEPAEVNTRRQTIEEINVMLSCFDLKIAADGGNYEFKAVIPQSSGSPTVKIIDENLKTFVDQQYGN
jgi:hypothetical protein